MKTNTFDLDTMSFEFDGVAIQNPTCSPDGRFTVNPKVMIKQDLTWKEPVDVMEGDAPFDLYLNSSAGLPVKVTSDSPNVCQFYDSSRPSWVTILGSGTCSITARADATDKYFEASGSASFYVDPKPVVTPTKKATPTSSSTKKASPTPSPKRTLTVFGGTGSTTKNQTFDTKQGTADTRGVGTQKTTITCKKGALVKPVTAVKPVCPTGWTLKKP